MKGKTKKFLTGLGIAATIFGLGYIVHRMDSNYLEKANNFYQEALKYQKAGDYAKAKDCINEGKLVIKRYYRDSGNDILLAADKAERISKNLKGLQAVLEEK